jgi:hypothetical protein
MATYSISAPDGKTYSIDGPEGASREQVIAKIKEMQGLGRPPTDTSSDSSTSPQKPGVLDKLVSQVKQGWQTMGSDVGGGGTLGTVLPTGLLRGAGQILSAPINAATEAVAAPIEEKFPQLEQARHQGQLVGLPDLASILGTSAGLVMPNKVGPAKAATAAAPAQEELLSVYKPLEQQGTLDIQLQPHAIENLRTNIHDALHDAHFRDYLAPQTFRAVKELEETPNPTVMDIEGVRRLLGNVAPQEMKAAAVARDKINDYLSEIGPEDVVSGGNVGDILSKVRGNYAAGKRSQMITMANEKGEFAAEASGSGANLDNTLRQQIKGILNNPKKLRGFSKEEVEQMRKIVKGGRIGNIARLLSKLGPKHPITGWSGAIAADIGGGAGAGMATLGTGHLAQILSEHLTKGRIKALDEAIRRRSPMGQAAAPAASPVPFTGMAAPTTPGIAALISQLGGQNAMDQQ